MHILELMTLACALAFVVLLAPTLWQINQQLHRLKDALSDLKSTLGSIRDQTAPLNRHLVRLQAAASGSERALSDAEHGLNQACERLACTAESEILMKTL